MSTWSPMPADRTPGKAVRHDGEGAGATRLPSALESANKSPPFPAISLFSLHSAIVRAQKQLRFAAQNLRIMHCSRRVPAHAGSPKVGFYSHFLPGAFCKSLFSRGNFLALRISAPTTPSTITSPGDNPLPINDSVPRDWLAAAEERRPDANKRPPLGRNRLIMLACLRPPRDPQPGKRANKRPPLGVNPLIWLNEAERRVRLFAQAKARPAPSRRWDGSDPRQP